ncbi:MAG: hypothetical protein KTM48_01685, partial [Wolbachia endosymbiont of Pissodes strobi]|nr:hypothetical protein [Wolbachia endosymbiont of Pissodes strobi]
IATAESVTPSITIRSSTSRLFGASDEDTPEFRASCEELEEEMKCPKVMSEFLLDGAIYELVDERMKDNISNVLKVICQALWLYSERRLTVGQMTEKWIKSEKVKISGLVCRTMYS